MARKSGDKGLVTMALGEILINKNINQWRLFWLITLPISLVMVTGMLRIDEWSGPAVSSLIQLSVRFAVPWLFVAFAASSLQILFPSAFTRWLLRNRKIFGLCFAAAMAWQAFFILWLVIIYTEYYIEETYVLRDAIEGVVGYAFIIAMTITSFQFGRQLISPQSWRWLHKGGIYFLWAYAYIVYWWAIFFYPNPGRLDYIFYLLAFASCAVRFAGWRKKQVNRVGKNVGHLYLPAMYQVGAWSLVLLGIVTAALSSIWRQPVEALLTGYSLTRIPETYLPYWPFESFIPLLLIALGAWLSTRYKIGAQFERSDIQQQAAA